LVGALALLLGCSIDDRRFSARGTGTLLPDGSVAPSPLPPGVASDLTVVPSYVELGSITQGFAARARVRVTNPGSERVAAPRVALAATSDADLTLIQNQCAGELAPGGQCDVRLQVVPSRVGALLGSIEISSGSDVAAVPVSATGLSPGPITLQPAPGSFQDFGGAQVGAVVERTFIISNPGAAPSGALSLSFNRPEFTLATPAAGECSSGVTDLASGQSCNVRVAFTPAERGPLESTLSVTSTGAGSRSLTLSGRGLVPAALGVSTTVMDFGGVVTGETASIDVEVENVGDDPMTLASAVVSPADGGAFRIADGNCGEGVVLAASQRCRIQLDYRPVNAGQPSAGELIIAAQSGNPSQTIALQGVALTRGNLLVEALAAGQENFGDVLLGEAVSRTFRISNPTQQASGVLALTTRNGFELAPPAEGACEIGVTELGNGQSCTVGVRFAPSSRGARTGAVTVDSPLAGAKSLTLSGRGVSAGVLAADTGTGDSLVDFGRVTTGASGSRTITVRNAGDQPLAPPQLEVTGDQAAAFSVESGCITELAAEATCPVVLRFAPQAAVPHAVSLDQVGAAGQRTNLLLLLGDALEPGRLVLAAADGAAPDFGDVAVGQTTLRTFSVTYPEEGVSGALTVATDDSQFVVQADTCAAAGVDGLATGETCSIDVAFTPTTNVATEARLSVSASSSGETGIALTGRGRLPSALAATTTERDLGRANLGQPSGLQNQFTWTVRNTGDLASGALSVTNENPDDFDITVDTCSDVAVPGAGSCELTIVFAPDSPGELFTRIEVVDATSALPVPVPLTVTGFGVQLAAPGERCVVSTDCMAGVCTGGVCCNTDCDLTCQTCATGECVAQSDQEPCGNAGGVCFGVEQCALPTGSGCATSDQCGGGLQCKACRGGGNQCTAPDACCGGCIAGHQCVNGQCGCPPQADGRPPLDCGGGLCAINRADACCPGSPPAGCNCDTSDNRCKECLVNAHCTDGLIGGIATCTPQRSCNYTCPAGTFECQGACVPNGTCCGGCPDSQDCVQGQCRIQTGETCTFGGLACVSGNCSGGRCCNAGCNSGCFPDGTCGCPPGQQFARGQCRGGSGATCINDEQCASTCVSFFTDADGDTFGDPSSLQRFCGSPPATADVVSNDDDCCDTVAAIRPGGQTFLGFVEGADTCPIGWVEHDFNCDGVARYRDHRNSEWSGRCDQTDLEGNDPSIPCAQRGGVSRFQADLFGLGELFDANDNARLCGNSSVQHIHCEVVGGVCTGSPQLAPTCL
jgi:hypothetical protein